MYSSFDLGVMFTLIEVRLIMFILTNKKILYSIVHIFSLIIIILIAYV